MAFKTMALLLMFMVLASTAFPQVFACGYCNEPPYSRPSPPITTRPPYSRRPPRQSPPYINPPPVTIVPPVVNPPPVYTYPPYTGGSPPSGGVPVTNPPPSSSGKCSIDLLKLGLCVDVLGLVHVGLGNPVENVCCPVLQGLLELEAAVCLCTAIRLKVLSLNIYIPLALQVLITCGKDPPPGYLCPAL